MRETRLLASVTLLGAMAVGDLAAQAATAPAAAASLPIIISIRNLTPREHRAQGFVMLSPGVVQLEAVGAQPTATTNGPESDGWPANAWILDARTRSVVWNLESLRTSAEPNGVHRFAGPLALPAGTYELHYASFVATSTTVGGSFIENIKTILSQPKNKESIHYDGPYVKNGAYKQFGVTVRGTGRAASFAELAAARKLDASVVAGLHPVRHDEVQRTAFSLSQATLVEITAIGEAHQDRENDTGWILDADSRHEVWRMKWANSKPAGGWGRNRIAHDSLRLPPGRYVAYFTTDDVYDPSEWTHVPPLDPDGWGMTLRVANPVARAAFKSIDARPVPVAGTLASITKVGDDETRTADFVLAKSTNVQVYALGESSGDQMADYAWIVDLDHHRRVWTMGAKETVWGGGGQKNREFDGVLSLPPGRYQLNYVSDDSHSFAGWNAAAPVEPEFWGASVWPSTSKLPPTVVLPVISAAKMQPLAAIHHVGDNLNAQVGFRMAEAGKLRIYAVGEGSNGGMSDYASIEDAATHRTVWTMHYEQTEAAGGAEKNRVFDGTIDLKAGMYTLRWRSDANHSWGRWNAAAPDDAEGWGVMVGKVSAAGGH